MKIRDLNEYIQFLTGNKSIDELGGSRDPLFQVISIHDQLKQHVAQITAFANDKSTQVFYELLINADDANANQIAFFIGNDYLIVFNNGDPFYTDILTEGSLRKGQLKAFIKGGDKFDDDTKIGKFGKGSKLIYDLMISYQDETSDQIEDKTGTKLIESIIEQFKGPILFSWNKLAHLESLFNQINPTFEFIRGDDREKAPIFCKIIFSYYPALPGERINTFNQGERDLFNIQEINRFLDALQEIRIDFNKINYTKGSLLYIPLGTGHHKLLNSDFQEKIIQGVNTSLPFLKNIEKSQINQNRINKPFYSIIELLLDDVKDGKVHIAFPTNVNQNEVDIINFYHYIPILTTSYGLKFIINTEAFELGQSRQSLDLKPRNEKILEKISKGILDYFATNINLGINFDKYISFFNCVLYTNVEKLNHSPTNIKKLYYDAFIDFFKDHTPINSGVVKKSEFVYYKRSKLEIPFEELGVTNVFWIHNKLNEKPELLSKSLGIQSKGLLDVLHLTSNPEVVKKWITQLADTEYELFLQELDNSNLIYDLIRSIPFIKCSDDALRSFEDFKSLNDNLFLLLPYSNNLQTLLSTHNVKYNMVDIGNLSNILSVVLNEGFFTPENYLKRIIDLFETISLKPNEKWKIYDTLKSVKILENYIKSELLLFCNINGVKKPLDRLFYQPHGIAPSNILNNYELRESENYLDNLSLYLLNKANVWEVLNIEWNNSVYEQIKIGNYQQILIDLNILYASSDSKDSINPEIKFLYTRNGTLVTVEDVFFDESLLSLIGESNYSDFADILEDITNYQMLPLEFARLLTSYEWIPWVVISPIRLINGIHAKDQELILDEDKILKIKAFFNNVNPFFDYEVPPIS